MSNLRTDFSKQIVAILNESIEVKKRISDTHISVLNDIIQLLIQSLSNGKKVILFGNGGSAADCQHIAAELVSKFARDRKALPAVALTTDTSIMTSIGNDYGFEEIFAKQVEALGQKGDVAIAISTSGNSANVLKAVRMAKEKGLSTIGLSGQNGGKLKELVDVCLQAPSQNTARIQEVHITVAHAFCDILEKALC